MTGDDVAEPEPPIRVFGLLPLMATASSHLDDAADTPVTTR